MGHLTLEALKGLGSFVAWLWDTRDRTRVVVLGLLLAVVISNLHFMRRVESYRQAPRGRGARREDDLPFVSILVPARNEELNIERCVASLVQQDYPSFEVLVLDDDSTDQTAAHDSSGTDANRSPTDRG